VHGAIERFDFQARQGDEHQWVEHQLALERVRSYRELQRVRFRQDIDRVTLDRSFDLERNRLERRLVEDAGGSGVAAQDVNRRLNRVEIERDLRQMNRDLRSSDPRPSRAVRRDPVGTRRPGVSRVPRR